MVFAALFLRIGGGRLHFYDTKSTLLHSDQGVLRSVRADTALLPRGYRLEHAHLWSQEPAICFRHTASGLGHEQFCFDVDSRFCRGTCLQRRPMEI